MDFEPKMGFRSRQIQGIKSCYKAARAVMFHLGAKPYNQTALTEINFWGNSRFVGGDPTVGRVLTEFFGKEKEVSKV